MAQDSFVQVAPDGAGKKIRNVQMDMLQADGTIATVQVQIVGHVTYDGFPVDQSGVEKLLRELIAEVRALRQMTGASTGMGAIGLYPDQQ